MFSVIWAHLQRLVFKMKNSDYEAYRILGMIIINVNIISLITCSGERTNSHDSWGECDHFIQDKVLSDERSAAYASDIADINRWWLDCKECNWYKSKQTILSEARLSI